MDKGNGCPYAALASSATFLSAIFVVTLILVRLLYVVYCGGRPLSKRSSKPVSTLIILGSGGHTAEMLNLLAVLQKDRFNPRSYVAAATDNMSLQKAQLLENSLIAKNGTRVSDNTAQFMKIYRSREVGQSYITSVWTTLIALAHALWLMIKIRPEVILCNGPGTCIPLCAIAFVFKNKVLMLEPGRPTMKPLVAAADGGPPKSTWIVNNCYHGHRQTFFFSFISTVSIYCFTLSTGSSNKYLSDIENAVTSQKDWQKRYQS